MDEYIDREDLEHTLKNYCRFTCAHYPSQRDLYCGMCMLGDVYAFIKKKSVVDVKPVVHGEWTDNEYGKPICSVCKKEMWRGAGGQYKPSDYCPSCGARMEIGE